MPRVNDAQQAPEGTARLGFEHQEARPILRDYTPVHWKCRIRIRERTNHARALSKARQSHDYIRIEDKGCMSVKEPLTFRMSEDSAMRLTPVTTFSSISAR